MNSDGQISEGTLLEFGTSLFLRQTGKKSQLPLGKAPEFQLDDLPIFGWQSSFRWRWGEVVCFRCHVSVARRG